MVKFDFGLFRLNRRVLLSSSSFSPLSQSIYFNLHIHIHMKMENMFNKNYMLVLAKHLFKVPRKLSFFNFKQNHDFFLCVKKWRAAATIDQKRKKNTCMEKMDGETSSENIVLLLLLWAIWIYLKSKPFKFSENIKLYPKVFLYGCSYFAATNIVPSVR